jgi:aminoglycoside 6'-N-acetyltransferase
MDETPGSPVPTLRGPRVLLRPITDEDCDRLLAILSEPEVARWWRRDEWERVVGEGMTTFVIVCEVASSGAGSERGGEGGVDEPRMVVGMIQFEEEVDPDYRSASVDLFLSSRVHGRGLGAEAIRVLIRYLIDGRGHHRFTIDPAVENERAIRCYTKVGFKPVGVVRQYERVAPGVYRDALLMDLLAAELAPDSTFGTEGGR